MFDLITPDFQPPCLEKSSALPDQPANLDTGSKIPLAQETLPVMQIRMTDVVKVF